MKNLSASKFFYKIFIRKLAWEAEIRYSFSLVLIGCSHKNGEKEDCIDVSFYGSVEKVSTVSIKA